MDNLTTNGLIDIGNAFFLRGEYGEAEKRFEQALQVAKANKGRRGEARALLSLGSLFVQQGGGGKALDYLEPALAFYELRLQHAERVSGALRRAGGSQRRVRRFQRPVRSLLLEHHHGRFRVQLRHLSDVQLDMAAHASGSVVGRARPVGRVRPRLHLATRHLQRRQRGALLPLLRQVRRVLRVGRDRRRQALLFGRGAQFLFQITPIWQLFSGAKADALAPAFGAYTQDRIYVESKPLSSLINEVAPTAILSVHMRDLPLNNLYEPRLLV